MIPQRKTKFHTSPFFSVVCVSGQEAQALKSEDDVVIRVSFEKYSAL